MLTVMDWFCGAGGSSQGAHAVPGVTVTRAANHWEMAIASHAANFPATDHYQGDIRTAPVHRWPVADLFWASPECPKWSRARGKRRDFHNTRQGSLFEVPGTARSAEDERSRALMEEVPLYLEGVAARGGRVLAGVVENVIDCRAWDAWNTWIGRIHALGYRTRIIALNSMHARPVRTPAAPQSRDRLYVAYWHESIGRTPDWDKWLRPKAWCPSCGQRIDAVQVFKDPRRDMGRYRQQYLYRCPHTACRGAVVEPEVLPAAAAIDWSLPGTRIGDRDEPLADATMERIRAGIARYWGPILAPAGGTWRDQASPINAPMPTRTTRENDGLAVPPLLVPVEGRDGKTASPAALPLRTQTTRNETGLAFPDAAGAFIAELRGGGSVARPVADALATVTASGNHHGLVTAPDESGALLVPYYGTSTACPAAQPVGALTTRDRYGLAHPGDAEAIDLDDVRFRMLEPAEIGRAMAFGDGYRVLGNKRQRVRQYGNAVTPPVAEVLISALVEAITGTDLEVAA
ncbi:DNA cytosine methyltransferase [Planomonospora sp. ID82291]|uniref:DNA cytosine methyltransferase n=1 Tax=Planomonospora sp. ID82291 TaxID=2738136 RepID=UPI0027DAD696|nr:DNA cytosine methyltransferase [Planomonospora sp. ID82291]